MRHLTQNHEERTKIEDEADAVMRSCSRLVAQPASSKEPQRPRILGIEAVEISSSNVAESADFYRDVTREICVWCEKTPSSPSPVFLLPSGQIIRLVGDPTDSKNLLRSVTYAVDDESAIKKYFAAKGVEFTEQSEPNRKKGHTLSVVDPEGHKLVFVQHPTNRQPNRLARALFTRASSCVIARAWNISTKTSSASALTGMAG
jgi:catechol 2,3-dioxygenase-like lactoylglutathione lyase family enzyme